MIFNKYLFTISEHVDKSIGEFIYRVNLDLEFGKRNHGKKLLKFLQDVFLTYPGPNQTGFKSR